jgi:hypothetical protein
MHSSKQGPEAEDEAAVLIHGDAEECRKHPRHGILVGDNLNHAIMILLNWRDAILTHMSVTVVAPTCQ